MKPVAQLDEQGYFVGITYADESPLEPGGFLIPGRCVDAPAPVFDETKRARWNGNGFDIEDVPVPEPEATPPPVTMPTTRVVVTMRQARLALLQSGLLTQVNTAISNMSGADGDAARIEWEYSSTMKREHPMVNAIGALLGLSESQLDDLFTLAASL